MRTILLVATLVFSIFSTFPAAAQLDSAWVVPAVAHNDGANDTFWRSDVSIHNPHSFELKVVVQFLPSNTANWTAMALDITLGPWETINLWDVLGREVFDEWGTGALLLYTELGSDCEGLESCDFLTSSRTYTLDPFSSDGEFGQAIPGFTVANGTDWWTYGYASGIINDDWTFRCNVGAMSWSDDWTVVNIDVQDEAGNILATEELEIPPFGHVQRGLRTEVTGATLVYYLVEGPDDAMVFPYASVVNEITGDPSFFYAFASGVGPVEPKRADAPGDTARPVPEIAGTPLRIEQSTGSR